MKHSVKTSGKHPTAEIIYGRNAVLEVLKSGRAVEKVYIQSGASGEVIPSIYRLARKRRTPIVQATRTKLTQLVGSGKHQGVVALISPIDNVSLETLLDTVRAQGEPATLLVLDRIQDPHNLGAIIRSAEVFGAKGIILPSRDTAPISETVVKASAGAIFYLPICKVTNLVQAVRQLKEAGFWVYASSSHAEKSIREVSFAAASVIIVGSEGKGIRPLLLKECDEQFRIPQAGHTESLNASVAAGIILYELFFQKKK